MEIKLSIGSAVYNIDEAFLRAHIEGILPQLTDETELLLIDDCSKNNSGEVCREYAEKDSRVRYINMGVNGGLSRVRNRTISESRGKWILFADSDDLLSEHFVQTALSFCDAEEDIIIHERLKFLEQKQAEEPCGVTELRKLPEGSGKIISESCICLDPNLADELQLPSRAFYHAAWCALYRRAFLLENELLFPDGQKKAQDAVFNAKTYFHAEKIAYLPYVMYYYRGNPQGITRRYSADLPKIYESLLGHLGKCVQDFFPDDKDIEERYYNHRIMACTIDEMRLNFFHKDNPNPKQQRKADFLQFIEQEPFKTAIRIFDAKKSGRWEWLLVVKLLRKKNFNALDRFVGNDSAYSKLCGAYKRLAKLFS